MMSKIFSAPTFWTLGAQLVAKIISSKTRAASDQSICPEEIIKVE